MSNGTYTATALKSDTAYNVYVKDKNGKTIGYYITTTKGKSNPAVPTSAEIEDDDELTASELTKEVEDNVLLGVLHP
ncbi:MAG: hypothetical protein H7Y18_00235 [Clostridiaceae bacterium]|nr:hypothetical protein [Clostridiaceae bacterium]